MQKSWVRCLCIFLSFSRHTNYIILWLSTVGPVVGLNLPLSYAKLGLEQNVSAELKER